MTPWVRFRVTRFGGIQPTRVMRATTDIGAEWRTAFPSHAQEVCEARIDTPCWRCLSSLQAKESKWLGILVLRTQELGKSVS